MNFDFGVQVCLVGAENAGKSSFLAAELGGGTVPKGLYRCDRQYQLPIENLIAQVTCTWLDVPGSPFYVNALPQATCGASIVLLFCDLTNRNAFEELQPFVEVHKQQDTPWILIGSKADLKPAFPLREFQEFAKKHSLAFHAISTFDRKQVHSFVSKNLLPKIFEEVQDIQDPVRLIGRQILVGQNLINNEQYQKSLLNMRC